MNATLTEILNKQWTIEELEEMVIKLKEK